MKVKSTKIYILLFFAFIFIKSHSQTGSFSGKITADGKPVEYASVVLKQLKLAVSSDTLGNFNFTNIPSGAYKVQVSSLGFNNVTKNITVKNNENIILNFSLLTNQNTLNEIVITGTLKPVIRSESPVPVEIYTTTYFKKNPTPSIYEALQNVNGIRPQLNCSVCNTGDIHINGLEGPYTMILIDGMPIVSSLSTVYGLSGIPNSLVERMEVVKGPASSLYGSEAVGGLINIITKKPQNAPLFSADLYSTSWHEYNADLGFKQNISKKVSVLTGINYFNFNNRVDKNKDNFTDMTLQNRISIFQKWNFERKENRLFSIAGRYMYEDRFGGEMNWDKQFRGGDSIYGESIYTNRWELISQYQLPIKEKIIYSFSYNNHNQDSRYGTTSYIAQQKITFNQLTWDKKIGSNDLLAGMALRYTFYDDNTPTTATAQKTWLPGIFIQDEMSLTTKHKLLLGIRYDYNSFHGDIITPRMAYKWSLNEKNSIRLNAGTGFRVVNLFTEDHAALTGSRTVEIKNKLNPEKSYNINLNYLKKIYTENGTFIGLESSMFYTYFNNRIVADYESDPSKIIYDNLNGFAESKGISLNADISFTNGLKIIAGGTLMENTLTQNKITTQQILTENFTATWAISYKIKKLNLSIDYTGNIYSPMRLPLLGDNDPRKSKSPWWSIQNIQFTYSKFKSFEIYSGVKNLLDWTPFNENNPFLISRTNDPFDENPTVNNPYGLNFDTTYIYAPTQGIRAFLGVRINVD